MERIASFCVDHTKLQPGMYLSRQDGANGEILTWDIRMKQPNKGSYLSPAAAHTLEHLFATYARNINVCLPSECGDTGFGNQSKCYLCKVYKCTPEEIPLPEPAQPKDRFAEGSFRNSTLEAEMED